MSAAALMAAQRRQHRRRYEQIMGDRPPKVTDRQFVTELTAKLDIHYLSSQRSKERQLADAEKKRQLHLLVAALHDDDESGTAASTRQRRPKHRKRKRRSSSVLEKKTAAATRQEGEEDVSADEWTELWPPNPSKSLSDSHRDANESRRRSNEARRLALLLRSLPSAGQSRLQQQPAATICSAVAADGDRAESCHCDDSNRDARAQINCEMTVDQLYMRASSLRSGRRL